MILDKLDFYCENYGFTKDKDMVQLSYALIDKRPNGIMIDAYTYTPYMLLLRASVRNPVVELTNNQLTICKNDDTSIANILLESIDNCISKWYNDTRLEMVVSMYGLCYKILINF